MRTLKYFLADAIKHKARVHKLYSIGAFLQAKVKNIVFVKLDSIYTYYFPEYANNLEEPWYYWSPCISWITLGSYLLMSWHNGHLRQVLSNINVRCLSIISMHHMDQIFVSYILLMTVSIGILLKLLKMVCGYFRKNIPCELIGICTLVHVNHNFSDEGSFHLCGSG